MGTNDMHKGADVGKGIAVAGIWVGWATTTLGVAIAWGPTASGMTLVIAIFGGMMAFLGTFAVYK